MALSSEMHKLNTSNWVLSCLKSFLTPPRKARRQAREIAGSVAPHLA